MKIALLSRNRKLYSSRRLIEAAAERGHEVVVIDVLRAYMNVVSPKPPVHSQGPPTPGTATVGPFHSGMTLFGGPTQISAWEMTGQGQYKDLLGGPPAPGVSNMWITADNGVAAPQQPGTYSYPSYGTITIMLYF